MNTDARDPLFSGLDELAGLADGDHVVDRMAGISRKARTNRIRHGAVVVASLALVVAGAAAALQLRPGDEAGDEVLPGGTTTSAPANPSALAVDLTVKQIGRTTLGVTYRIHGTSHAWSSPEGDEPLDFGGPRFTRVLLDGEEAGGSDGGAMECRAGTPEIAFDETWQGDDQRGLIVDVPGPGTYAVTVQAPSCGADGKLVPNEVTRTVTVTDPELAVTDEVSADIDGDGRADQVRLLMPEADRVTGHSDLVVAEVTRASGQTTEVQIAGGWTPRVGGQADLNGDGVPEVQIVSEGEDHAWWTVLTFTGGQVVAATPILSGAEWIVEPETGAMAHDYAGETYRDYQVTWVRGDQLVTWFAGRAWDGETAAEVTAVVWGLDGADLSLSGQTETVCVTADRATWTDPAPC